MVTQPPRPTTTRRRTTRTATSRSKSTSKKSAASKKSFFKSTEFTGTIRQNSDEVETFWQNAEDIPYGEMREADQDFIPEILSGKYVKKRYIYDENFKLQKIICL